MLQGDVRYLKNNFSLNRNQNLQKQNDWLVKNKKSWTKKIMVLLIILLCAGFLLISTARSTITVVSSPLPIVHEQILQETIRWYEISNSSENISVVGKHVFLHKPFPKSVKLNRTFNIVVWKNGASLNAQWLRQDPFPQCSVNNCKILRNYTSEQSIRSADVVVFHIHRILNPQDVPKWRTPNQRWVFFTEESPFYTFFGTYDGRHYNKKLIDYNGVFNWSMHYRMDADVPVPYARTIPLENSIKLNISEVLQNKTKLVATMGTNCGYVKNNRWLYVKALQKYIQVDVFGKCGTLKCNISDSIGCSELYSYKFYLAFENGNCKEYITEKPWLHGFDKYSVPIVMGTHRSEYERLLPPNSFIHVNDFSTPKELAKYINFLDKNQTEYEKYFSWREHFRTVQEHGYFGLPSAHYCRLCEALNYNDESPKVYNSLQTYWDQKLHCKIDKRDFTKMN